MKYNRYTKNTPKVSQIGFGAWQLGNGEFWHQMSDQEAISLVHEALDLGVNYFDTVKKIEELYNDKIKFMQLPW